MIFFFFIRPSSCSLFIILKPVLSVGSKNEPLFVHRSLHTTAGFVVQPAMENSFLISSYFFSSWVFFFFWLVLCLQKYFGMVYNVNKRKITYLNQDRVQVKHNLDYGFWFFSWFVLLSCSRTYKQTYTTSYSVVSM